MKFEDVPLKRCKELDCLALHWHKSGYWCGAKRSGSTECIHPENRKQEVKNDTKTGS